MSGSMVEDPSGWSREAEIVPPGSDGSELRHRHVVYMRRGDFKVRKKGIRSSVH